MKYSRNDLAVFSLLMRIASSLEGYRGAGGTMTFNRTSWSFDKEFSRATIRDGLIVIG